MRKNESEWSQTSEGCIRYTLCRLLDGVCVCVCEGERGHAACVNMHAIHDGYTLSSHATSPMTSSAVTSTSSS